MNNLNKIFILSEQNQSDYIHTAIIANLITAFIVIPTIFVASIVA